MDKEFHDILSRYVRGECSPSEIELVRRWYEAIEDRSLELDDASKEQTRLRILSAVQARQEQARPVMRQLPLTRFVLRVAAAIALLVALGAGVYYYNVSIRIPAALASADETSDENQVIWRNQTSSSQRYELPDGSQVTLEPLAQIRFGKDFLEGDRQVHLMGKAFFDVRRDESRPFHVFGGQIAVKVLGTSFFVDAPEDAVKVEVKVVTGNVSVFPVEADDSAARRRKSDVNKSTANGVVLSPNQTVEYFTEGGYWVMGLVEDPVPVKSLETDGLSFLFDNTPISEIISNVNERYGIEIVTENESIGNCTFTGDVSSMSLYDMLDVITSAIGSTYEVRGTRILVSGKGCR